jgi:RND family efflux transporter MFP subunit
MLRQRVVRQIFLLPIALSVAGCGADSEVVEAAGIRPAKLIEVRVSPDVRSVTIPAVIEAATSTELTFQVGGLLEEIAVRGGQEVNEGDVIARLDQRDFTNELLQSQAQYDQAQSEFARAERLIIESAISRSVYEQRQTQFDIAEAALDSASKRLEDSVLRAPFNGVIAQVPAEAFQTVGPQQPIVVIQSTGIAEAVAQVPATLVARSGQIEPIETRIVMDIAPESPVEARLLSSDTRADPTTQTFDVRFVFEPPAGVLILPGMTGSVQVQLRIAHADGSSAQLTVPLEAIISSGSEQFVWLVDPDTMVVTQRVVEVGAGIGETLAIRSGLMPGDLIVGAGAAYLHEGMQIRRYEP